MCDIFTSVGVWYRKTIPVALFGLVVFVSGCSDTSFFVPQSALSGEVGIDMADDGAVRGVNDNFRIAVELPPDATFDRVEIDVLADDGAVEASFEHSRDDFGADLYVDIPLADVPPGLFTVETRVLGDSGELSTARSKVFVVENEYALSGLSAFPARVFPGAKAILRTSVEIAGSGAESSDDDSSEANADSPDSPNSSEAENRGPWIRWRVDGEVVASGPLSDGLDELEWQSPEDEGVHRFRVDLYPFEPGQGDEFSFDSEISVRNEVYVGRGDDDGEAEFGPADSYFSLFRFQGMVRDEGVRGSLNNSFREGESFGDPELRVERNGLGYYLDGNSGFEISGVAVPFLGSSLAPFSLNTILRPDGTPSNGVIFATTEEGGAGFRLELRTDSEGIPRLVLENDGTRGESSARYPVFDEESVRLSVSVSPGTEYTTVLWFVDGRLASIDRIDLGFPASPLGDSPANAARQRVISNPEEISLRDGITRFGHEANGFSGLVDEFGVYFRDSQDRLSTDDGLFRDAMESTYASRLAYARGFEGLFVPDELETVGRVTVRAGELVLEPDSSVYFPAFLFEDEDLIVEVVLGDQAGEARGEFEFEEASPEGDGAHLMTGVTDGAMRFSEDDIVDAFAGTGDGTLLLRMRHEDDSLYVRGAQGEERVLELQESRFEGVRLTARHPEDRDVPLRIMSLLAHRDRTALAERLDFSWDE